MALPHGPAPQQKTTAGSLRQRPARARVTEAVQRSLPVQTSRQPLIFSIVYLAGGVAEP